MNRAAGIGLRVAGVVVLLAASALSYRAFAPDSWRYADRIAEGNREAQKIDGFLQRTGHLPANLNEIGGVESAEGPIYYQRCSQNRYVLWFGTSLGHSMTFDSASRKWDSLNITCQEKQ